MDYNLQYRQSGIPIFSGDQTPGPSP